MSERFSGALGTDAPYLAQLGNLELGHWGYYFFAVSDAVMLRKYSSSLPS